MNKPRRMARETSRWPALYSIIATTRSSPRPFSFAACSLSLGAAALAVGNARTLHDAEAATGRAPALPVRDDLEPQCTGIGFCLDQLHRHRVAELEGFTRR